MQILWFYWSNCSKIPGN